MMVTVRMIAEHAGRHPTTITRALKAAGIEPERIPGAKGLRLPLRKANRFLSLYYPESGQMEGGAK